MIITKLPKPGAREPFKARGFWISSPGEDSPHSPLSHPLYFFFLLIPDQGAEGSPQPERKSSGGSPPLGQKVNDRGNEEGPGQFGVEVIKPDKNESAKGDCL